MAFEHDVEKAVKAIAQHVKQEVSEAEKHLQLLDDRLAALEKISSPDAEKIEKRLAARLDERAAAMEKRLQMPDIDGIERKLEARLNLAPKKTPDHTAELEKIRKDIGYLSSSNARIDAIEKQVSALPASLESKIRLLQEELEQVKVTESELKKESIMLGSIKKKMQETRGDLQSGVLHRLAELESQLSILGKKTDVAEAEKIAELEKKISSVHHTDIEIEGRLEEVRQSLEEGLRKKATTADKGRFESLRKEFESIVKSVETKSALSHSQLEKKLQDMMEKRLAGVHARHPEKSESRLEFLEEEIKKLQKSESSTEEKAVILASIDKKMQDTDLLSKDLQAKLEYLEKIEKDMDRKLDEKALKIFTKQLEDFSRVMERRFPSLVTKDELYTTVSGLKEKLQSIESPDLAPLAQKVDFLEKRVESIYELLKHVSNRIPVIVE